METHEKAPQASAAAGQNENSMENANVDDSVMQYKDTNFQPDTQMLPEYFVVLKEYFKRSQEIRNFGDEVEIIKKIDRQTAVDVLGKDRFAYLKRYEGFCSMPSHTNYQRIIMGKYINLYHPLPFQAASTPMPTPYADILMQRIFGDYVEKGWQYMAWLYQCPTQPLPVVCLGSIANHTGKTTFLEMLNWMYGDNAAILSSGDLLRDFMPYGTKLITAFEEVSSGKKSMDRLKLLATASRLTINRKNLSEIEIDSCAHVIITTNRPDDFLKISSCDIRFWVLVVPPMTQSEFDPMFKENLKKEIPALMRKLADMPLCEKKSRMVFDPQDLRNDALDRLVQNSRSDCAKSVEEWINLMLDTRPCFDASATDIWNDNDFPHARFTPYEIGKALKDELGYPKPTKRRYTNIMGSSVVGQAFHFYHNDNNTADLEDIEKENLPF